MRSIASKFLRDRHLLAPSDIFSGTELSALSDLEVIALDVGARGGFDQLLRPIAPVVSFVGFDPDAREIERLQSDKDSTWKDVMYLPVALGARAEERPLYLTRSPGCISLLPSNPEVYRRYSRDELFDIVGTTSVSTIGLDDAAREYDFKSADYLKIDIQGAELEVLESGEDMLQSSLSAIRTEVEFQSVYQDQPLFGDIDRFLAERGFVLSGFHNPISWSLSGSARVGSDIERDCAGDLIHTDAFYIRHPDAYTDQNDHGIEHMVRGALVVLALGRISHASNLLLRPRVCEYLADVKGVNASDALESARRLMRRHVWIKRWSTLARAVMRN